MPSTETSPRPWRVKQSPIGSNTWIVSGETFVASASSDADAALIVAAVNERESLFADMKIKEAEMRLKVDAAEKERAEAAMMRDRAKEWHSVWLKENEKLRDKLDASEAERDRLCKLVKRLIPAVEESFAIAKHEAESIKWICALNNVDSSEVDAVLSQWENLLQEARAAIGEEAAP